MLAAYGCGGSALDCRVEGTVTLDGKPLTTGVISFLPATGAVAYGTIASDGRYDLRTGSQPGAAAGDYVVTVAANASPEPATPRPGGPQFAEPLLLLVTPRRYAGRDTTPLKATVRPGRQTLDFTLQSE